jgi:hypothetical protein
MTPNSASSHSLHSLGRSTTLRAPYANVGMIPKVNRSRNLFCPYFRAIDHSYMNELIRQMKSVIFVGCYAGIRGLPLSRPILPYLIRRDAFLQSMLVDQSP